MRAKEFTEAWNPLDKHYKEKDPKTGLPIGPAQPEELGTNEAEAVLNMIKTNCGGALASSLRTNTYIKRGMPMEERPYFILDPTKTIRKSANTNNAYTLFTSMSPKWKKFPPRQQSIICSTSDYAADYGNVYAIFPFDDAPVGICREEDFWTSFNEGFESVRLHTDLGEFASRIMSTAALLYGINAPETEVFTSTNAADAIKVLKSITLEKAKAEIGDRQIDMYDTPYIILDTLVKNNLPNALALMDKVMDPTVNGFISATGANCIKKLQGSSQEVWIGGKAIAVSCNPFSQQKHPELKTILRSLKLNRYVTPDEKPRPALPPNPKVAK